MIPQENFMYPSCAPQWGPNAMGSLPSLLFILGCASIYEEKPLVPKRPHIVLMIADDLGWNDVSFHGSKQIPTPNVDAIARDGIILNQYYVQHICSPSRGSLMTGKYPIRIGFQHGVILANSPWGLPLKEKILPQYLKDLKYSTHAVGKWHLGFFKEEYLPTRRGFDSFFGYYTGKEDYFTHAAKTINGDADGLDLHENEENVWNYNGTYGSDLFTMKAKNVIFEHDPEKPLFLYLAQQAVHSGNFQTPLQAPDRYVKPMVGINDGKRKTFAGVVSSMDNSVGEIFEALEIAGLLDDTIFIFSTDNGGATQGMDGTSGSNWPLRGGKHTLWEGGVRGVSFIWSPFLRERSRIHNGLMHITDWLPTLLSAAGGEEALQMLPKDIDGFDQWSSIINDSPSPRSEILLNIDDIDDADGIRRGRYKLLKGSNKNGERDNWYDREGRSYNMTYSMQSPFKEMLYRENYIKFLTRSKAASVLWYKYEKDPRFAISCDSFTCEELLEIDCGPPPSLTRACNPMKEPCLYDAIRDPCEHYNIANQMPQLTSELEEAIEEYRSVSIPAKDLPEDPDANPDLHGNAWNPWK